MQESYYPGKRFICKIHMYEFCNCALNPRFMNYCLLHNLNQLLNQLAEGMLNQPVREHEEYSISTTTDIITMLLQISH